MGRTLEPSIRQVLAGAVGMAVFVFLAVGVTSLAWTTQPWSLIQTAATIVLSSAAAWTVLAWASGYRRATPTEVEAGDLAVLARDHEGASRRRASAGPGAHQNQFPDVVRSSSMAAAHPCGLPVHSST